MTPVASISVGSPGASVTVTAPTAVPFTGRSVPPAFASAEAGASAAANGDEVTGTFTFSGPPPSPEPHEVATEFTITGGTGRFADASGTVTIPLVATPSCFDEPSCPGALGQTVEGPLTGQISY
jgi:hypothetical protein